jgi:hypothetical protein
MKRRLTVFVGVFLTLLLLASLGASAAGAASNVKAKNRNAPAKITWTPRYVDQDVSLGQTATVSVSFTSSKDIASPSFVVRPDKETFVQVANLPTSIVANTSYPIELQLSVPAGTTKTHLNAILFLKDQHVLAMPLAIRVNVPDNLPARITWSPTKIEQEIAPGGTATVQATFTSSKAIAAPSYQVRPDLAGFIQINNFPSAVAANIPYTVELVITVPADYSFHSIGGAVKLKDTKPLTKPLLVKVTVPQAETETPTS